MKTHQEIRRKSAALLAVTISVLAADLFAVPACPDPFEVKQSDGTVITLHNRGDEFLNWHEDAEGYTVVRDEHSKGGDWYYAELDQSGTKLVPSAVRVGSPAKAQLPREKHLIPQGALVQARQQKAERMQAVADRAISTSGTVKQLVVLVQFSDVKFKLSNAQSKFNDLFNKIGYSQDGNMGSVRDFYREISYGKLDVQSTVVGPITLSKTYAYYGADSASSIDANSSELGKDVVDALHAQGFDFSPFDANNDGWVDDLDIIHAGWGQEVGGNSSSNIWSVRWTWRSPYYFAMYDGVKFNGFHTEPELRGSDTSTNYKITQVGVICHEFGHSLGLPDLYDTDYTSEGAGDFCLMAGGSWGRYGSGESGTCPAQMSAWCKVKLGWVTPTVIASAGTYSLPRVEDNAKVYKLHGNFSSANEYFLLENKTATGFGRGLPGTNKGLLIWHVDDSKTDNTNESHYMVDLEEASGTQHLELGDYGRGDDNDYFRSSTRSSFTSTTSPNNKSYSGTALGLDISGISASGSTMTFTVSGGGGGGGGDDPGSLPDAPSVFIPTYGSSAANASYISVTWGAVSGATSYNLYRSETTTRPSTPVARNVRSPYSDYATSSGLIPGKKYYYWVSAANAAGESFSQSDWGNILVSLSLNPTAVTFGASGGTATVTVSANAPWNVITTGGWVSSTPSGMSGNGTVVLTAQENSAQSERTGTLQIIAGSTTSYPATKTVSLKQSAAAPQPPPEFVVENNVLVGYNGMGGEVTIPRDVKGQQILKVGAEVFRNNVSLTSVSFPDTLVEIGDYAFYGCSSLCQVAFNDGLLKIGNWSFQNCGILSVSLPASLTSLGTSAFFGCRNLTDATLNQGLKTIKYGAFYYCKSLTAIEIPDSVTDMDTGHTFYGCTSLSSVTIGKGLKTLPQNCFFDCTNLTDVTVPATVETIGFRAFYGCTALSKVTISNGVKTVGENAFDGCTALTELTIPASVTTVGNYAFIACSSLTKVNYLGNAPSVQSGIYRKTPSSLVTLVTAASTGWNGTPGSMTLPAMFPANGGEDARAIMRPGNPPVKPILTIQTRGADAREDYIEIAWQTLSGETYNIYRSTTTSRPSVPVATGVAPNYRDTPALGLNAGTVYYYWIESVTSLGSAFSDPEWGNLAAEPEQPDAPVIVSAEGDEFGVTVEWNGVEGATEYAVYRSRRATSRGDLLSRGEPGPTYFDSDAEPGVDYWYTVSARNAGGETFGESRSGYRQIALEVENLVALPSEGGESTLTVRANADWSAKTVVGWVHLTAGNGYLAVEASANETTAVRETTIELVAGTGTDHPVTKQVTVRQAAGTRPPAPDEVSISGLTARRYWPDVSEWSFELTFNLGLPDDVESVPLEFAVLDADTEEDLTDSCSIYTYDASWVDDPWSWWDNGTVTAAGAQRYAFYIGQSSGGSHGYRVLVRAGETGEWIPANVVRVDYGEQGSKIVIANGTETFWDGERMFSTNTALMANGFYDAELKPTDAETAKVRVFNAPNAVVEEGRIASNAVWTADCLHILRGNVVVPEGLTLTIANGTEVRSFNSLTRIHVQQGGKVVLQGVEFAHFDIREGDPFSDCDYFLECFGIVQFDDEDDDMLAGELNGSDGSFEFQYSYTKGQPVGELPVPDDGEEGCVFGGWVDENDVPVDPNSIVDQTFPDMGYNSPVYLNGTWIPAMPTDIYAITSGSGFGIGEVGYKVIVRWNPVPSEKVAGYKLAFFREGEAPTVWTDVDNPWEETFAEYVCDDVPEEWAIYGGERVFCRVCAKTTSGLGEPLEFSFDLPLVLELDPDETEVEFGGSVRETFKVTANAPWTIESTVAWISVDAGESSGSVGRNISVSYAVEETVSQYERSGRIRVTCGQTTRSLLVTQQGNPECQTQVDTPVITPQDGTAFTNESCTVTISCATRGAVIYYTTDGTAPTSSSKFYEDAFEITETTEIRAIAVKSGLDDSEIARSRITKFIVVPDDVVEIDIGGMTVAIPKVWLEGYYPDLKGKPLANYGAKALEKTLKRGCVQDTYVWQDYVAGTDPTNADSVFRITSVSIVDGTVKIEWSPKDVEGRVYQLYGREDLGAGDWRPVDVDKTDGYRFFKVTVDLEE